MWKDNDFKLKLVVGFCDFRKILCEVYVRMGGWSVNCFYVYFFWYRWDFLKIRLERFFI